MPRIILLAVALLTAIWAADLVDGGPNVDPNGSTTGSDGHAVLDPNGGTNNSDGGNGLDPNG